MFKKPFRHKTNRAIASFTTLKDLDRFGLRQLQALPF